MLTLPHHHTGIPFTRPCHDDGVSSPTRSTVVGSYQPCTQSAVCITICTLISVPTNLATLTLIRSDLVTLVLARTNFATLLSSPPNHVTMVSALSCRYMFYHPCHTGICAAYIATLLSFLTNIATLLSNSPHFVTPISAALSVVIIVSLLVNVSTSQSLPSGLLRLVSAHTNPGVDIRS